MFILTNVQEHIQKKVLHLPLNSRVHLQIKAKSVHNFNVDAVCLIRSMNTTRYKNTLLGSDWIPALLLPAVPSISWKEKNYGEQQRSFTPILTGTAFTAALTGSVFTRALMGTAFTHVFTGSSLELAPLRLAFTHTHTHTHTHRGTSGVSAAPLVPEFDQAVPAAGDDLGGLVRVPQGADAHLVVGLDPVVQLGGLPVPDVQLAVRVP